ncbi:MAG: methyltransferase [Deltaproteobacteria bacterium]|nr:methyltransferase [Deltaproteobacteria bacterium]MBT4525377.1 methyltransferase [Deltaproteobacteria bacterium]
MKITSDACLFGGYAAEKIKSSGCVLDIGTGTGLLSLMIIQKNSVNIDALEIDQKAAHQASNNFKISKWRNQLNCINTSLQKYSQSCFIKYDFIICNPPFHHQKSKSLDLKKRVARHDVTLTMADLLYHVSLLLKQKGSFFIFIPFNSFQELVTYCEKYNLFINETISLKPNETKLPNRIICQIQHFKAKDQKKIILNHIQNNQLSEPAKSYVSEYYLNKL